MLYYFVVTVQPESKVVGVGRRGIFSCYSGSERFTSIRWLLNGIRLNLYTFRDNMNAHFDSHTGVLLFKTTILEQNNTRIQCVVTTPQGTHRSTESLLYVEGFICLVCILNAIFLLLFRSTFCCSVPYTP